MALYLTLEECKQVESFTKEAKAAALYLTLEDVKLKKLSPISPRMILFI